MKIVESAAGKIVVEHDDGYVFTFQIHPLDGSVMDLEGVTWPLVGPPPDADDLEMEARRVAEQEAQAQGWL